MCFGNHSLILYPPPHNKPEYLFSSFGFWLKVRIVRTAENLSSATSVEAARAS